MECVEPNPGPVWDDVWKSIQSKTSPTKVLNLEIGVSCLTNIIQVEKWKPLFRKFEKELGKKFSGRIEYTIAQVKELLDNDEIMQQVFGLNADAAQELIKDNILNLQGRQHAHIICC